MSNSLDDTELRPGSSPVETDAAHDDTVVSNAAASKGSRPAIRPAMSPVGSPDYPALIVVDPAHYVVTREIARGGMGRIHVARDRRLGREVAVKEMLVKSAAVARRFEREARITARLQHPGIVSVHEAGTWPTGDPFYAMHLVSGRSLDEVITATPTYEGRVALVPNVLAIADAMAYAHDERVIHRDLKPRNIVIGAFGETIVIDWGLAKDLRDPLAETLDGVPFAPSDSGKDGETTAGDVLGTPAYIPPEQAAGTAVDERADVYAIGAILYHVLSGRAPFVADNYAELISEVHSGPPRPIAELAPNAPTELLAIVERAMARDPAARYPIARGLADDLRRFQSGQLVGAHRYSMRQLLRRWIRRHRTAVTATAAAVLVALGVGIYALVRIVAAEQDAETQRNLAMASQATAEQQGALAIANQKRSEELLQFMLTDLRPKLGNIGRLDLLDTVARRASTYYDAENRTASDEDLYMSGKARLGIASVFEYRGDLAGARAEFEKGRAVFERAAQRRPNMIKWAVDTSYAAADIARVQAVLGELPAALVTQREALARSEQLLAAHPGDPDATAAVVAAYRNVAGFLEQQGDLDGALQQLHRSLALAESNTTGATPIRDQQLLLAHSSIGRLLDVAKRDFAGALAEYRLGLAIGEAEAAKDPMNTSWLAHVATSHSEIAKLLIERRDLPAALVELRAGLAISERLGKVDASNTEWATTSAVLHERVGDALFDSKNVGPALAEYRASNAIWQDLTATDPRNLDWQRSLTVTINKLGEIQFKQHDIKGALASFETTLAVRERLVAKDPSNAQWQRDLFYIHIKLGGVADAGKDYAKAVAELRAALAIAIETARRKPKSVSARGDVAATHQGIADELLELHDFVGARAELEAAQAATQQILDKVPADPDWKPFLDRITKRLAKLKAAGH